LANFNKQIKIGARSYSISVESPKINQVFAEHEEAYGYIDYITSQIKLRAGIDPQFQLETLLHELLHGMLDNSGIEGVNTDTIAKVLAPRLHAFLIDNPSFQTDILNSEVKNT